MTGGGVSAFFLPFFVVVPGDLPLILCRGEVTPLFFLFLLDSCMSVSDTPEALLECAVKSMTCGSKGAGPV